MNEEKTYPIYSYHIKFINKSGKEDLIGGKQMFKEEKTKEELDAFLTKTIQLRKDTKNDIEKVLSKESGYCEHNTWCLTWFSHMTFNIHLTDEELLKSFSKYVAKYSDNPENHALMGAEDRWRWKGPCRCKHCKERGMIRIDH